MRIIKPITTICDHIISNSIPQNHDMYDPLESYSKDDLIINSTCGAVVYRSLVNGNLGNDPNTDDGSNWVAVGPSNPFAMFDDKVGTQSVALESIVVEIEITSITNAAAAINIVGNQMRFEAWNPEDVKVFDQTFTLREHLVSNMYDYYFQEFTSRDRAVELNLPILLPGSRGKMTLTGVTGTDVKIGSLIYGKQFKIGDSQYGQMSVGIKDYSTKEADVFGNYTIVERPFQNRMEAMVVVSNANTAQVKSTLSQYRATPVLWIGDANKTETIVFGFFEDFRVTLPHPAFAECRIRINGVS
jgi:hypothetical protein